MSGTGSNSLKVNAVSNVQRRTWDDEETRQKLRERKEDYSRSRDDGGIRPSEAEDAVDITEARKRDLGLESTVGRTQVVMSNVPQHAQGGFYCDVCDITVKDSSTFYDHCNSMKHLKNMGHSVTLEKSTADDVRSLFSKKAPKKTSKNEALEKEKFESVEERAAKRREIEEEEKKERREKKKARKEEAKVARIEAERSEMMGDEESAMMAAMGLPVGLAGSAHKK